MPRNERSEKPLKCHRPGSTQTGQLPEAETAGMTNFDICIKHLQIVIALRAYHIKTEKSRNFAGSFCGVVRVMTATALTTPQNEAHPEAITRIDFYYFLAYSLPV